MSSGNLSLTFHGAAQSVTGSCTLVRCGERKILVDCGMVQGGEETRGLDNREFPFRPDEIDAVILTHGHLDHSGRIPLLVGKGFTGPIFCHAATGEIARIIWLDTVKVTRREGRPLYDEEAVEAAVGQLRPLAYQQSFEAGELRATIFDAGHILGSAHVVLEGGGKRLLFSGDVGPVQTPIIRDPWTQWTGVFDAAVIESTYGNRFHKDRGATVAEFSAVVKRAVEERGVILIPSFAIGRTQEMLFCLNDLIESGKAPALPVFIDSPMAGRITEIYRRHRDCYDEETRRRLDRGDMPLDFTGLRKVVSRQESESIRGTRPPFIVIAGSGMCNGGRILNHLREFAGQATTTVMFVGYQGNGTLGRKLVDGAREISLAGEPLTVAARVETLNGFSAHADQAGLLSWAKRVPGPGLTWLVNHGEEAASRGLATVLCRELGAPSEAVERGREYSI